jgi:DNA-binding GntR family transcriptional regulator
MSSMVRSTLAEQAYEALQNRIVSGVLSPGQRLRAEELADSLDISQTPVKEALALLERDGLVEGTSRRGATVRQFSLADVEDIYAARTLLELHAAETGLADGRANAQFVADLRAIFAEHMTFVEKQTEGALSEAIRLDRAFHELIVGLAQNRIVASWHRMMLRQTQTIRNYPLVRYDVGRTRREHCAIVEAFAAARSDAVIGALRGHLDASRDEFLSRPPEEWPVRP